MESQSEVSKQQAKEKPLSFERTGAGLEANANVEIREMNTFWLPDCV